MKTLFLTLALAIGMGNGFAQTTFAPLGATWQFGPRQSGNYWHARVTGAIVSAGKSSSTTSFYEHHSDHSVHLGGTLTTVVSGDTVLYSWPAGRLVPLYVFNVKSGDTLLFYKRSFYNTTDSFFHVRIDSVKPMLWGNAMLKTVWGCTVVPGLNDNSWSGFKFADTASSILYVERLGAINGDGLTPWARGSILETPGPVSCYYDGITDARLDGKDSCSGIPENVKTTQRTECSIYPNPVISLCSLLFAKPLPYTAQLAVYDVRGQKQSAETLPAGITTWKLDLRKHAPGIYLLEISSGTDVLRRRLIKE